MQNARVARVNAFPSGGRAISQTWRDWGAFYAVSRTAIDAVWGWNRDSAAKLVHFSLYRVAILGQQPGTFRVDSGHDINYSDIVGQSHTGGGKQKRETNPSSDLHTRFHR